MSKPKREIPVRLALEDWYKFLTFFHQRGIHLGKILLGFQGFSQDLWAELLETERSKYGKNKAVMKLIGRVRKLFKKYGIKIEKREDKINLDKVGQIQQKPVAPEQLFKGKFQIKPKPTVVPPVSNKALQQIVKNIHSKGVKKDDDEKRTKT